MGRSDREAGGGAIVPPDFFRTVLFSSRPLSLCSDFRDQYQNLAPTTVKLTPGPLLTTHWQDMKYVYGTKWSSYLIFADFPKPWP